MRLPVLLAAAFLLAPAVAEAQPSFAFGGGLSSPVGGFADASGSGYHVDASVQVVIPTLPVSLRAQGDYHRLSEGGATVEPPRILAGTLGVVFTLPAVGLAPYFLAGVGRYRVDTGPAGVPSTIYDNGFQLGFGIQVEVLFAELRWVRISRDAGDAQFVPFTVGFRL